MKENLMRKTSHYFSQSYYNGMFLQNRTSGTTGDDICKQSF